MIFKKLYILWFWFALTILFISSAATAQDNCNPDQVSESTPTSRFIDNNDGIIPDMKTGLIWRKCNIERKGLSCENANQFTDTLNWQEALALVESINNSGNGLHGFNDWRIPNIKELISIVEYACTDPTINAHVFPFTLSIGNRTVWSSTISALQSGNDMTLTVNFQDGSISTELRNRKLGGLRLVRGK